MTCQRGWRGYLHELSCRWFSPGAPRRCVAETPAKFFPVETAERNDQFLLYDEIGAQCKASACGRCARRQCKSVAASIFSERVVYIFPNNRLV